MKLGLIAFSATALLCAVGSANAQSNTTAGTATSGTLCSDLLALDTTSQGAFLQGYQAAMQDELVTAGAGVGANAMASSSSLPGGTASTLGATGSATGSLNTASIVSNCQGAPTSPLSQIISGSGAGAGVTSSAQ
jgi:hypothetical protein